MTLTLDDSNRNQQDWMYVQTRPIYKTEGFRAPTFLAHQIIAETAEKHGITVRQMKQGGRARMYSWPRQEAMYRIYTELHGYSLPRIGRLLGGRDHTTVIHGIRRFAERSGHTKRVKNLLGKGALPE
jgi:chromosomal replication initiation ATPase DnaA